ncbi:hypothetical protein AC578_5005 [Pseudocercospora eumusae]|uniref:Uncharacterized protein n=1 Tax=Pseudocercospora eumusae TaxID=321146 RepID=A0A139H964_9PEZI|nr:hypothetical protein AC578_5005 [Pseudocercospora eumusae]
MIITPYFKAETQCSLSCTRDSIKVIDDHLAFHKNDQFKTLMIPMKRNVFEEIRTMADSFQASSSEDADLPILPTAVRWIATP